MACGAEIKILRITTAGVTVVIKDTACFAVAGAPSERKGYDQIELYFGWRAVPGLQKALNAILEERKNLPTWARGI